MLEAIVLFLWTFAVWLLLQQQFTVFGLASALAASVACVLVAARLPRLGRGTFTRMPRLAAAQAMQMGGAFADAFQIVRAAIAADVRLRPALVRVRTRTSEALGLATLANLIGASPGAVVIASDEEGLLVHVNQEGDERFAKVRTWDAAFDSKERGA
jgi:multisubunit Na+/H+ antiporter MnhE subunit